MKAIEFALLLSLLGSMQILAAKGNDEAVQLEASNTDLLAQIQIIERLLQMPEYIEITAADNSILESQLAALKQGSLDGAASLEARKQVNAILKQAFADSRLVCTTEKVPNSHMRMRYCQTVAAKKRESQKALNTSAVNKPVMVPNN
jgi:hypothetical protein